MRVKNHKIEGFPFRQAKSMGGAITPEIVIVHDTASRLTKGSAAQYLRTASNVSVHFVIERDGTIEQQVPLNRAAWHAGRSSFNGRGGCNGFSIGIEIVNPGIMSLRGEFKAVSWWGEEFDFDNGLLVEKTTPQHGDGVWMSYTPEQIDAVETLLRALFDGVPTLKDITTHWYVSPGRKVDTNPLFPLEQIRARILGRDDPADDAADMVSAPPTAAELVRVKTAGSNLNLRRWPSINPNVIGAIPNGEVLPTLRVGDPTGPAKGWVKVLYGGLEGWVAGDYLEAA